MREWLRRALRTFVQAIVGYVAANLVCVIAGVEISDGNALKTAIIGLATSAIAAGIAAVMNLTPPVVDDGTETDTDTETETEE